MTLNHWYPCFFVPVYIVGFIICLWKVSTCPGIGYKSLSMLTFFRCVWWNWNKWAFLNHFLSVCLSLRLLAFYIYNVSFNFDQTWHKHPLVKVLFKFVEIKCQASMIEEIITKCKTWVLSFKNLLKNYWIRKKMKSY